MCKEKAQGESPPPAGAGPAPPGRPACAADCRDWKRPSSATESLSSGPPWLPAQLRPHRPTQKNRGGQSRTDQITSDQITAARKKRLTY